jgi:hypothetical protein
MGTVKVNGQHRKLVDVWTKVDGVWRQVDEVSGKENGAWKPMWKNNFPKPSFISYPTSITRGQTITVTTENIDGADYALQVSYNGSAWQDIGIAIGVNSMVTIKKSATHYESGEPIESAVKGIQYQVTQVKNVSISFSKKAYRLNGIPYWVLEQDILESGVYNGGTELPAHPNPAISVTISTDINHVDVKFRICAVEPGTSDKRSTWMEGPVRSLQAQQLPNAPGFNYPGTITRGDTVWVSWEASNGTGYNVFASYADGNNNIKEDLIYGNYPSVNGWFGFNYTVSTDTKWKNVRFKIKAVKTGYKESSLFEGPNVVLGMRKLAFMDWMDVPTPVKGTTITISWKTIPNAVNYLLEVIYDTQQTYTRVYFGPNKAVNFAVPTNHTHVQFRVKAMAPDYLDADWRYAWQYGLQMPEPPLKSSTWTAAFAKSWRPNFGGQWHPDNNYVYQGSWNDGTLWGDYTGLVFFNFDSIRSTLAGKKIEKVQIYFYRINAGGYNSGQPINLHTHNYGSLPPANAGRPSTSHVQGPFSSFARGEGKWITVSNTVVQRILNGQATGLALNSGSGNYLFMSADVKLYVEYR